MNSFTEEEDLAVILPIKPVYSERILSGVKKYEYRKRLCKRKINRIYIYETAPVKKIAGYVEVTGKLRDTPENIWNQTNQYAGIDYQDFCVYFSDSGYAGAYVLGKAYRYPVLKDLKEFGIDYIPQSYVYIHR